MVSQDLYSLAFALGTLTLIAAVQAAVFYFGFRIGQQTIRPVQIATQQQALERQQRRDAIREQHGLWAPGRERAPGGYAPITRAVQRQYQGVSGVADRRAMDEE